jgi:hypothetical protein
MLQHLVLLSDLAFKQTGIYVVADIPAVNTLAVIDGWAVARSEHSAPVASLAASNGGA